MYRSAAEQEQVVRIMVKYAKMQHQAANLRSFLKQIKSKIKAGMTATTIAAALATANIPLSAHALDNKPTAGDVEERPTVSFLKEHKVIAGCGESCTAYALPNKLKMLVRNGGLKTFLREFRFVDEKTHTPVSVDDVEKEILAAFNDAGPVAKNARLV